jgi:hypothetical protein
MQRRLLTGKEHIPARTFGIRQAAPHEVINLVGDYVDEVGSVIEQGLVENDFAASEKTRREYLMAGTGAKFKLAAVGAQFAVKANR